MSRRTLINLILFGLTLIAGLLVWLLQPVPLPLLTSLQPEQIHSIRITNTAGRDIQLKKSAGQWRLNQSNANTQRIEQLLGITTTPSLQRFPVPVDRLAEFGLGPPGISLWLNEIKLDFGTIDPIRGWRYVLLRDRVHLIGDGFYHHLTAGKEAYLDEISPAPVQKLPRPAGRGRGEGE